MTGDFDKHVIKGKVRLLSFLAHLKRSIVEVKAPQNSSAHAIITAISKLDNDANYKFYR